MHLHIVSFNVPWPADYGGVIDVYYRIKTLAKAGYKIHLHCYTYGRDEALVLNEICEEVNYYPREVGLRHQFERRPYIVASRNSRQLIDRLKQDDFPILIEGLHGCFVLEQLADGDRKIIVRTHNVEHDYYLALARSEKSLWKKVFFLVESRKLKHYEQIITRASGILAISESDAAHFRRIGCHNVSVLPPSHCHDKITSFLGKGEYILYQGNLSVAENVRAVVFMAQNLIPNTKYPFIIAGRDPSDELQQMLKQFGNVTLVANPSEERMHELLANAQVNVLVTDQPTGVKLKLINALYEGRFCLVNSTMVSGTHLKEVCVVEDNPQRMLDSLNQLMITEFTENELLRRKEILNKVDTEYDFRNILI